MPDTLARTMLARAALRFNARGGFAPLPPLIFLTDDERTPDPLPAIAALPRGSLVIVRSRDKAHRRELAHAAARIARSRALMLSVASDAALAAEVAADGLHLSESEIGSTGHHRLHPRLLTCAAHSAQSLSRAHRVGAHAALLSPVFVTQSHAQRAELGIARLRAIVRASPIAVYALGGITAENVAQLNGIPLAGIAAIGALLP